MRKDKLDNKGFTLIEILVSIVILAILLVPAFYSFFSAARINTRANSIQKATILAQNIQESLKNMTLEQTALEFYNGNPTFSVVNSNLNGFTNDYKLKTYFEGGFGEYTKLIDTYTRVTVVDTLASVTKPSTSLIFTPPPGRKTYYFGIADVADGSSQFDALVTLDASEYSDTVKYTDTMNNYKMPGLLDFNQDSLAAIDLEGANTTWSNDTETALVTSKISTDEQAISDFMILNSQYIADLASAAAVSGEIIILPDPISRDSIIANTKKYITVGLSKDMINNKVIVQCSIIYQCMLDLNGDGFSEELPTIQAFAGTFIIPTDDPIESNVYLFYTPSQFNNRDTININNNGVVANVFIANQTESTTSRVTIMKTGTLSSTNVFTNLTDVQRTGVTISNDYNKLYAKDSAKDRIFSITVSIYPAGAIAANKLDKSMITFTSTREEE